MHPPEKEQKSIPPSDLVLMDELAKTHPLVIDLAYVRSSNLLFEQQIYRAGARLWLHKDLAAIVTRAAEIAAAEYGLKLVLYDGLRTTEAQQKMLETRRVQNNPHWLEEPRLLSPPGTGGHPRGMAVDVSLIDKAGTPLDMGTPFDYLTEQPGPETNPAHRKYAQLSDIAKTNRAKLDHCMTAAAHELKTPLLPLPQEWWDYRLPSEYYERFAPLSDADLPPDMRMT